MRKAVKTSKGKPRRTPAKASAPKANATGAGAARLPEALRDITGYHIRRMHALFGLHWTDWFGTRGLFLTPVQGGILMLIDGNPDCNQTFLARELRVESPTLLQALSPLITNGFVVRRDAPTDRRAKLLSLSEAGQRAADMVRDNLAQHEQVLLSGMTAAERKQFFGLLRKALASAEAVIGKKASQKDV